MRRSEAGTNYADGPGILLAVSCLELVALHQGLEGKIISWFGELLKLTFSCRAFKS